MCWYTVFDIQGNYPRLHDTEWNLHHPGDLNATLFPFINDTTAHSIFKSYCQLTSTEWGIWPGLKEPTLLPFGSNPVTSTTRQSPMCSLSCVDGWLSSWTKMSSSLFTMLFHFKLFGCEVDELMNNNSQGTFLLPQVLLGGPHFLLEYNMLAIPVDSITALK